MNPVSKFVITVLVLTLSVVLLSAYQGKAQRQSAESLRVDTSSFKERERAIIRKTDYDPPAWVRAVKTKGRFVTLGEKFIDEDDWLKGLVVLVRNDSNKAITHIGVRLLFRPLGDGTQLPAKWLLGYGPDPFFFKTADAVPTSTVPNILPGGELELKLSDGELANLEAFLKQAGFPDKIHVVEIRVNSIGFTDGTAWNGKMLKRDSGSGHWTGVKTEGGALYNHPRVVRGSAQGSPDSFFSVNFLRPRFNANDSADTTAKSPNRLR